MVYLDNASSTRPFFFAKDYSYFWGNPNSSHRFGREANEQLEIARKRIMKVLGVKTGKVLFCRCASEAASWLNRMYSARCYENFLEYDCDMGELYCSPYEHDSVNGIEFKYPVANYEDMFLYQHTNHITGKIFDIESHGKIVKNRGVFFGSDFTATIGHSKVPENLESFCDAVWFSGRKIHCETMGAIWLSEKLYNFLGKGKNEISGTPNVGGAIALSYAAEVSNRNIRAKNMRWKEYVDCLVGQLEKDGISARIYEDGEKTYAINALILDGVNAESLVQFLSMNDIFVSPLYSACTEKTNYKTAIALGISEKEAKSGIRVSFSIETEVDDVKVLADGIKNFVEGNF